VAAGLPFHGFIPGGEEIPLPGDQRVQLRTVDAEIRWRADETAMAAENPDDRPVPFGCEPRVEAGEFRGTHLRVIRGKEFSGI
jgi:hypothetical protein